MARNLESICYTFQIYTRHTIPTVGENIIATTKIRNNYVAIQSLINVGLFSIAPCQVITLNPS